MILSYKDLDKKATAILKDYLGRLPCNASQVKPIDIESFATDCLGLRISYAQLSDQGDILGLTTYADVEVEIESAKSKISMRIPKDTILIDSRLQQLWSDCDKKRGRRRFTIAHECSHQILFRQENAEEQQSPLQKYVDKRYSLRELVTKDDWSEWQANAIAAALLMPARCIKLLLLEYNRGHHIKCYENRFTDKDRHLLSRFCNILEVSKSSLVIRLRQLGFIDDRPYSEFSDPLEVVYDESFVPSDTDRDTSESVCVEVSG